MITELQIDFKNLFLISNANTIHMQTSTSLSNVSTPITSKENQSRKMKLEMLEARM